jgi:ribose transport system substrate-binding protein
LGATFVPGGASGAASTLRQSGDANALRAATASTARAFRGTFRNVDPTPRTAVGRKRIAVISAGQAADSAKVPSDAAMDAARAIGWEANLFDAQLNPSNGAPLVRQAIASGVNGIILVAIDCRTVKQPLVEARASGIAVIGLGAFDCNDPHGGGDKHGLFSAEVNIGVGGLAGFFRRYGQAQGNYIVSRSRNQAKIIVIDDPEFATLYYTRQGFEQAIGRSGRSKIVDTLDITTADLVNNQLVPKIQGELARHPEADWIKSPYTYATTLGIVPALGPRAGEINVMGDEGFEPELDLIRTGKVTAVNAFFSDWAAWAGVDAMNSVFRHEKPHDSGLGWMLVDRDHNLPRSGPLVAPVDYQAEFERAWGVG